MGSFIRSFIFNILFYSYMIIGSFGLIWMFLLPRKWAARVVKWYFGGITYLERWILGLTYRVKGLENLPADGRYILAMKHQSAYETLKLMPIFGDIAIALKRELTWIPLWGWYTIKTGMIPIDRGASGRGARGRAMESLVEGGKRAFAQGRPLIIYPQGTRTPPYGGTDKYPYKAGVARLAEALDAPIIPVAVNSGVFWGKKAFIKKSGVVDFEILPPITYTGKVSQTMSELENTLETHSNALRDKAELDKAGLAPKKPKSLVKWAVGLITVVIVLFAAAWGWASWWAYTANHIVRAWDTHTKAMHADGTWHLTSQEGFMIRGFPFEMEVLWPELWLKRDKNTGIQLGTVQLLATPVPFSQMILTVMGPMQYIEHAPVPKAVNLGGLTMRARAGLKGITITSVDLEDTSAAIRGAGSLFIPYNDANDDYAGAMTVNVTGQLRIIQIIHQLGLIDDTTKSLMESVALGLLEQHAEAGNMGENPFEVPITIQDNKLYVGMIEVLTLKAPTEAVAVEAAPAVEEPAVEEPATNTEPAQP